MRKGFLATLALLALVQAQGTPPAALPVLASPLPTMAVPPVTSTATVPVSPPPACLHDRQAAPVSASAPAIAQAQPSAVPSVRARWPATVASGPLEVPLGALAPSRAGELTLLGMR